MTLEDDKINAAEQVFRAEQFKATGDLTVIRDLQRDLQIHFNAAARKYLDSDKTALDKAVYMRERSTKCSKAYEDKLLELGLITRTLTAAERQTFEMISWFDELTITTEKVIGDEGESCGVLLWQVRQYLYYVATVLGTEKMQAVGDLAPLGFSSNAHKEAYDTKFEPYTEKTFTQEQVDAYEADKNYAL